MWKESAILRREFRWDAGKVGRGGKGDRVQVSEHETASRATRCRSKKISE